MNHLRGFPGFARSVARTLQETSLGGRYLSNKSSSRLVTVNENEVIDLSELTSRQEALEFHERARERGERVLRFFTGEDRTLKLARYILEGHPHEDFLSRTLLEPAEKSTHAQGSKRVTFTRMEDQPPQVQGAYLARKGETALLCVGGPASIDLAFLSCLILQGKLDLPLSDVAYLVDNFKDSNLVSSAHQLHARHGTALNADAHLTGHALLGHFLSRAVFGTTDREVRSPDFRKIDLPLSALTPRKLAIYARNELNWLRQFIREKTGQVTEHDFNRRESVFSREVMRMGERLSGLALSTNTGRDSSESAAIHVDLTPEGRQDTLREMQELEERVGIGSQALSDEELRHFFGPQADHIAGATRYFGDSAFKVEGQQMLVDWLVGQGATYRGERVAEVVFARDETTGGAKVAGIVTAGGEYLYASHVKLSLGYMADYRFAEPSGHGLRDIANRARGALGLDSPVPGHHMTVATGMSVTVIMRTDPKLREEHGSWGQYAVTNSHWTEIASKGDLSLVRITGGGTTGVEDYNPDYFLDTVFTADEDPERGYSPDWSSNTQRIFGPGSVLAVIEASACSRALNDRNSTEIQLAANLAISHSKGGTGNTKRHAEGLLCQAMLFPEHRKELLDFLDQYVAESGKPLGQTLTEIHETALALGFLTDGQQILDRGLGYDRTFSDGEKLVMAALLAALAALAMALKEALEPHPSEPPPTLA